MRYIMFISLICFLVSCAEKNAHNAKNTAEQLLQPCPSFAELGKPALVYGAECGTLAVKENPADANSPTISLNILRLPAISPAPKEDPLFLIQGGPGGSSVDMAEMVHFAFSDVRKNRDLIFVDQRGTGKSNPLQCEKLSNEDNSLIGNALAEKNAIRYQQCAEKYKNHAVFYTTPYAVNDLDAVRNALGYPQINVWGVSYGTRVALEYLRRFPSHTRAVVLDGVAPVQLALPKYFQEDAWAALEAINAECSAQEKCNREMGDIIEKANLLAARIASAEASGKPLRIEFKHPQSNVSTSETLTGKAFSQLVFMSLYSRDLTVLLPHAIAQAERGNYQLIGSLFVLASEKNGLANISEAMRLSVICNEDAHYISSEDIANAKPFFAMDMFEEYKQSCSIWPKAQLPADYFEPINSDKPVLLISGGHDPVTPSRWAKYAAQYFPNSLQLIASGGNHAVSLEGCMPKIISQFIQTASIANLKTDCVKDIIPLPIVLGANEKKINSSSSQASASFSSQSSVGEK